MTGRGANSDLSQRGGFECQVIWYYIKNKKNLLVLDKKNNNSKKNTIR